MFKPFYKVLATSLLMLPSFAQADDFPTQPIRMVVPYAAGGVTDTVSRQLAKGIEKQLKQTIVVDNKPGANTAIGARLVAMSKPDGYTLLMATGSTLILNPMLYKNLSYNAEDLIPVSLVAETPLIFTVNNKIPADSIESFVKLVESKPKNTYSYASTGTGTSTHLAAALFMKMANLDLSHIPFNGSMPAYTNLVGGQVDLSFDSIASALPFIKDGRLKPIAVTTTKRLEVLPDTPTVAEKGYKGYSATAWYVFALPKGTDTNIVTKYREAINEVLKDEELRKSFANLGVEIFPPSSAEEMLAFMDMESKKWGDLIQSLNITLD